ncbi:hypothetical protein IM816_09065 [Luteibacter flocculans]|uniref:ChaN family lipoprotein n=1 Tax=Luteibacter flocculans TaxID=2780091 RepID=A0ABY4TBD4_9GAMM|nr:DUF5694 domain-containing protein [Luteibacter flocculans]URL60204.1 hypothetical protein IM816_09065 [Luteibacter flocculans]
MCRWVSAAFLAVVSLCAGAQEAPQMMFLGSGHLANHNRDVANTHVEDVRTPARQAEIETMVARLAAWKPTHVAIEYPYAKQAELDKRYADYRAGRYTLTADETDQIGLRLAKQLGLPRVDAVDWNDNAPGKDADYDWMAWAKAHGKADLLEARVAPWKAQAAKETEYLKSHSVTEWYLMWNDPKRMAEDQKGYFDLPLFGDDSNNPGAAWVGQWYARNLRIFTHIRALATKPDDRVLVIYGAGHGPHLRKDAVESNVFRLVEPQPWLTGQASAR